jgi:hypothetical protein
VRPVAASIEVETDPVPVELTGAEKLSQDWRLRWQQREQELLRRIACPLALQVPEGVTAPAAVADYNRRMAEHELRRTELAESVARLPLADADGESVLNTVTAIRVRRFDLLRERRQLLCERADHLATLIETICAEVNGCQQKARAIAEKQAAKLRGALAAAGAAEDPGLIAESARRHPDVVGAFARADALAPLLKPLGDQKQAARRDVAELTDAIAEAFTVLTAGLWK